LLSKGAKCFVYDDSETEAVKNAEKRLSEKGATIVYKSEVNELFSALDSAGKANARAAIINKAFVASKESPEVFLID
jgi:muramoyltetrapeptide carboxypeptidase LdcA involved in peptidoglycan recycling